MTAPDLHPAFARQSGRAIDALAGSTRAACAVSLVDRRTGQTHRINGSPLVLFTRTPEDAVAELLSGRDTAVWEARVEPIGTTTRIAKGRR